MPYVTEPGVARSQLPAGLGAAVGARHCPASPPIEEALGRSVVGGSAPAVWGRGLHPLSRQSNNIGVGGRGAPLGAHSSPRRLRPPSAPFPMPDRRLVINHQSPPTHSPTTRATETQRQRERDQDGEVGKRRLPPPPPQAHLETS